MPPVAYSVEQIRRVGVKRGFDVLIGVLVRFRGQPWIAVLIPIKAFPLEVFEIFQKRLLGRFDPLIVTTRLAFS